MKLPFFISRSGHYEPIAAVRFLVLFNTATLGFQSVSGISTRRSVEYISEGGRNDYPILVLDEGQNLKAIYSFISQGVVEWELSDLDASRSAPLIETFTVTHSGLKNIPVPSLF